LHENVAKDGFLCYLESQRRWFCKALLEVEFDERSLVCIDGFASFLGAVGKIDLVSGEVVDHGLEVTTPQSGKDVGYGVFDRDVRVMLSEQLVEPLVEGRAHPVHPVVDYVLDRRVPGCIQRQQESVVHDVQHAVTVLETTERVLLAITDTQDQVACPFGGLKAIDRLIESLVPLKNVPEHEGEGVAEAALLPKGLVVEVHSDFTDS
jgi:hypothetical protein